MPIDYTLGTTGSIWPHRNPSTVSDSLESPGYDNFYQDIFNDAIGQLEGQEGHYEAEHLREAFLNNALNQIQLLAPEDQADALSQLLQGTGENSSIVTEFLGVPQEEVDATFESYDYGRNGEYLRTHPDFDPTPGAVGGFDGKGLNRGDDLPPDITANPGGGGTTSGGAPGGSSQPIPGVINPGQPTPIDTWIYDAARGVFRNQSSGHEVQNDPSIWGAAGPGPELVNGGTYTVIEDGVSGAAEDRIEDAQGNVVGQVGQTTDGAGNIVYGVTPYLNPGSGSGGTGGTGGTGTPGTGTPGTGTPGTGTPGTGTPGTGTPGTGTPGTGTPGTGTPGTGGAGSIGGAGGSGGTGTGGTGGTGTGGTSNTTINNSAPNSAAFYNFVPNYDPITPTLPGGIDTVGVDDVLVGGSGAFQRPYSILPGPATDPRLADRRPQDLRNVGAAVGLQYDQPADQQDPRAMGRLSRYANQFQVGPQELSDTFGASTDQLDQLQDLYGVDFEASGPSAGGYNYNPNNQPGVIGGGLGTIAPENPYINQPPSTNQSTNTSTNTGNGSDIVRGGVPTNQGSGGNDNYAYINDLIDSYTAGEGFEGQGARDVLLQANQRGISPDQLVEAYGQPDFGIDQLVPYIQDFAPASDYLSKYGYAEGGPVEQPPQQMQQQLPPAQPGQPSRNRAEAVQRLLEEKAYYAD